MGKKGPKCQCCAHPERWRIELLRAGGASLDSLAKKFGISRDSIHRHWGHISPEMKASYLAGPAQLADLAATAATEGASVLDHFRVVRTMLMSQLALMTEAGDGRGAAIVAGTLTAVLEKLGKLTGEIATIAQGSTVNIQNNVAIVNSPAFARVQAAILRALSGHSAARAAVVAALQELDAETPDGSGARLIESKPALPLVIDVAPVAPPPY